MKNLVVCVIILVLGILGPQQDLEFEPVWSLGLLLLLAFVGQQVAASARLPAVVGWLAAGLIVGPSLLDITAPTRFLSLRLIYAAAALWVGLFVGARVNLADRRFDWRLPITVCLATVVIFVTTALALVTLTQLPGWQVALYAALFSLWGPFAIWYADRETDDTLFVGTLGTAFSLALLTLVLIFLDVQKHASPGGAELAARIWISLLAGAVGGELIWRLRLFAAPRPTFLTALAVALVTGSFFVIKWGLFALLCGLAAGLAISLHRDHRATLDAAFSHLRPMIFPLFFALMGACLDARSLLTGSAQLVRIVLISAVIMMLVRGLAPSVWPALASSAMRTRRVGWLLLPKGALLFDITFTSEAGVAGLLVGPSGSLLRQVVMADILLFLLVFSALAAAVWRFSESAPDDGGQSEPEQKPATAV